MTPKISLIGAGSVVFAKTLLSDLLQFPELARAHFCLMDIDPARLKVAGQMTRNLARQLGVQAVISETLDAREAVTGANFVICTVQVGGYKPGTVIDFEIPHKYGVRQTIADTLGPGGVFRALRTIPVLVELARHIEAHAAPGCLLLNYTNPMAMNCWAIDRAVGIPHVGLCHSVQGTSAQLATYAGLPKSEITYLVAGINHMAFFLKFEYRGQDAYPLLFQALENSTRRVDKVRFEMMRRLGYFVTESSEHQAEYVPYFIPRGDKVIRDFEIPINEYLRRCEIAQATWEKTEKDLLRDNTRLATNGQSHEYGAYIIHSMLTHTPRVIYGNVSNRDYITNLPDRCCVEVPCLVDANGIQPTRVGDLPSQLAAICQTNINVQALTVEAALSRRRESIYHAVMMDPNTSATLSIDKIWAMCDEMIEAHQRAGLLGEFTSVVSNTGRSAKGMADRSVARLEPLSELARVVSLELRVTNPGSALVSHAFHIDSEHTPLRGGMLELAIDVPAGQTRTLSLEVEFTTEPGATEHIVFVSPPASLLAIGAKLRKRPVIDASSGTGNFEIALAGFPAVKGSIQTSDEGMAFMVEVADSNVPRQPSKLPWEGSSLELFFSSIRGGEICQIFILPDPSGRAPVVLSSNREPLALDDSKQTIGPRSYNLQFTLPWKLVSLRPGTFLFDCYANISALGDAHSGGLAMLGNEKGSNAHSTHFHLIQTNLRE